MTTYSRGMGRVQLALSHLQQELHEGRARIGALPCCLNLEVHFQSATSGQRDGDDGGLAWLLEGSVGSRAALSYILEQIHLMAAGRSDICFWWAEETERVRDLWEVMGFQMLFKLLPYSSLHTHVHTELSHAHHFPNHLGIQTT